MDKNRFKEILKKVDEMKKTGTLDLSTEEDLSIAVMNLISLEEHFFFTGAKTKKREYFDMLVEIREMRKFLLEKMINKHEGETWCISKHLLATAMRLIEVGTKLYSDDKRDDAKEMYDRAYSVYAIFWALRLKMLNNSDFKGVSEQERPWTYQDIVNKLVDCCDE